YRSVSHGESLPLTSVRQSRLMPSLLLDAFLLIGVPTEQTSVTELAELVPHHILGDEHVDEVPPVMHLECVPDEFGNDGACASPRLDRRAAIGLVETLNLAVEALDNIWAFFQRS